MPLRLLLFHCAGVCCTDNNLVSLGTILPKIKPFTLPEAEGLFRGTCKMVRI